MNIKMQTPFQHPVRLRRHVECFGGWRCRVRLPESAAGWGERVVGMPEPLHPLVAEEETPLSSSLKNTTKSHRPGEEGNEWIKGERETKGGWGWR